MRAGILALALLIVSAKITTPTLYFLYSGSNPDW